MTVMAGSHVEMLRQMDEAMMRGDIETMFSFYADDVDVHIGGQSRLAGDYHGIEAMQELFGRFMAAAGEYSFENLSYLADDKHGVIVQRGTMSKDGQTLTVEESFMFHFRDGKISEFWYFPFDQNAVDDWFGR
jgi:ketosteroid isomerase-like protein